MDMEKYTQINTYPDHSVVGICKQQIEALRIAKNLTQRAFAIAISVDPKAYLDFIDHGKSLSKVATNVIDKYPDLNLNWFLRGEGQMFTDQEYALAYEAGAASECAHQEEELAHTYTTPPGHSSGAPASGHPSAESPSYTDIPVSPSYIVAEGESVDRAMLNYLLRELANRDQRIAILEQRNLTLERENAVQADRLQAAETWYRQTFPNKKG